MEEQYDSLEMQWIRKAAAGHIPLTANLELLPLCNMSCEMCYVHLTPEQMRKRGRMLSVEEWIGIVHQLSEAGTLFVLLTGGEPLLFPGFKELYLELVRMGMIVTLNTNGTLLNEEWADFFAQHRPRRINITLYGASEETYRSLCHFPEGFERTLNGIRLLKSCGVDVKLNASVVKANIAELDALYRIGEELDVPVFPDTYMLPGLDERELLWEKQARLTPEQAAEARWKVWHQDFPGERFDQFARKMREEIRRENVQHPDGISCQACASSCAVNWQGHLQPCVTIAEPYVDLLQNTFAEGWKKVSSETQKMHLNSKCVVCQLRPLCEVCVGNTLVETGRVDGVPEYCCRMSERLLEMLDF